jgi:hypothetical protein
MISRLSSDLAVISPPLAILFIYGPENCLVMNDTEFKRLLKRRYAHVVMKVLLETEGGSCAFCALRDEVNSIVADDSRGAKENSEEGYYSPASLSSLLSAAKDTGIVTQYLNEDGQVRWRLSPDQLSQSQIDEIRSRNSASKIHMDTASQEFYFHQHTDSSFQ